MGKQRQIKGVMNIKTILKEYGDEVLQDVTKEAIRVANKGKEKLMNTRMPPETSGGTSKPASRRQWNRYARNWDVYAEEGGNFVRTQIYNIKEYRLTHLLEDGHITRDGTTRTRAFKHNEPVRKECIEEFAKGVEEKLKG